MRVDVAVIGSGAAGLCAAISARQMGASVAVVSKASAGRGGCTALAGGRFTFAQGGMTPSEHAIQTLSTGRNLGRESLVRALVNWAPEAMEWLEGLGVELTPIRGGATLPGNLKSLGAGLSLSRALVRYGRAAGIQFLDRRQAVEIRPDGSGGCRVRCLDLNKGGEAVIDCGAVVLATGGAGQAYGHTNNPSGATGDGFSLALDAGLSLVDMEFVQFFPLAFSERGFRKGYINLKVMDKVRVTDGEGNPFLEPILRESRLKDWSEGNLYLRDKVSFAMARVLRQGGSVLMHMNELDESERSSGYFGVLCSMYPRDLDPASRPVQVAPIQHYTCGGVEADPDGKTGMPGLYVCGEVAGGVDGANRVGGNALTSCVVFGRRAGRSAAAYSLSLGKSGSSGGRTHWPLRKLEQKWSSSGTNYRPAAVKTRIKRVSDSCLGPLRSAQGLEAAVATLTEVLDSLPGMSATGARELAHAYDARSMALSALAIARAALARAETRGVHGREDFPSEDPALQHSIKITPADLGLRTK